MVLAGIAAFVGISAAVICTPGPDTALTVRNAVAGGRRSGVATAVGVASGLVMWSVAASFGLAALLRASEPAFLALRLLGATYLLLLGVRALWAALTRRRAAGAGRVSDMTASRALRQGLISNLGNPKIAVFFTSLLPQFAPGRASFSALLPLGLGFALLTLVWLTLYALAAARAWRLLARSRVRAALDAVTGFVLLGAGLRLAAEHR